MLGALLAGNVLPEAASREEWRIEEGRRGGQGRKDREDREDGIRRSDVKDVHLSRGESQGTRYSWHVPSSSVRGTMRSK